MASMGMQFDGTGSWKIRDRRSILHLRGGILHALFRGAHSVLRSRAELRFVQDVFVRVLEHPISYDRTRYACLADSHRRNLASTVDGAYAGAVDDIFAESLAASNVPADEALESAAHEICSSSWRDCPKGSAMCCFSRQSMNGTQDAKVPIEVSPQCGRCISTRTRFAGALAERSRTMRTLTST